MSSPRTKKWRAALAAGLLFAGACGSDDGVAPPGDSIDLLVRRPDVLFEQPGPIVPVPLNDWGDHGGPGWGRLEPNSDQVLADGSFYIEANQPKASLTLTSPVPLERTIEVDLWCSARAKSSEGEVALKLNGFTLGSVTLADERTRVELKAPAALWNLGDNTLEFETPAVEDWDGTGPRWDRLAVSRVAYGEERRVVYDLRARRYELPATTGVRFLIEPNGPARLEIEGTSKGGGELALRFGRMNARLGTFDEALEEQTLSGTGSFEGAYRLPEHGDDVVLFELTWLPRGDAPFELETLRVVEDQPVPRPPIVLISVDTLSARHMSIYGYDRPTTPKLEEFAQEAIVFERCVANAPWTLPSYLSALTGLYPSAHLVRAESGGVVLDNYDFWQAAESRWTIAEMLRARGYQTAASLDTLWLSPRFHVDQGFDVYDLGAAAHPFHDPYYGIRYILDQFHVYFDEFRNPSAPFFAFIHTLDVHGPYWPEKPFLGAFDGDLPAERTQTPAGSAYQSFRAMPEWMANTMCPEPLRPDVRQWTIPNTLPLEDVIARYDETILKTDRYLDEIFELLREQGVFDDALIVITADHGESFEHDAYSHGVLWEDVIHIPLVIKLPNSAHGGTRVKDSVQLVDLYATLYDYAGAGQPRDYLHGRSLRHLIEGGSWDRPTFSEGGLIDQRTVEADGWKLIEIQPGKAAGVASLVTHPIVGHQWLEENLPDVVERGLLTEAKRLELRASKDFAPKFAELQKLYAGPFYQLFDLNNDPREQNDLHDSEPARVAQLKALMQAARASGSAAQADAKVVARPPAMSAEDRAQLEALGYTGEEGGE